MSDFNVAKSSRAQNDRSPTTLEQSVPTVAELSDKEFATNYRDAMRPVVLRGGCAAWSACHRWAPTYFDQVAGSLTVPVKILTRGDIRVSSWPRQKEPTFGNCAVGSGSVRRRATSGWSVGGQAGRRGFRSSRGGRSSSPGRPLVVQIVDAPARRCNAAGWAGASRAVCCLFRAAGPRRMSQPHGSAESLVGQRSDVAPRLRGFPAGFLPRRRSYVGAGGAAPLTSASCSATILASRFHHSPKIISFNVRAPACVGSLEDPPSCRGGSLRNSCVCSLQSN